MRVISRIAASWWTFVACGELTVLNASVVATVTAECELAFALAIHDDRAIGKLSNAGQEEGNGEYQGEICSSISEGSHVRDEDVGPEDGLYALKDEVGLRREHVPRKEDDGRDVEND